MYRNTLRQHVRDGKDGIIRAVFFYGTRTPDATVKELDYAFEFGWRRDRAGLLLRVKPWDVLTIVFERPWQRNLPWFLPFRVRDLIRADIGKFENVIVSRGFEL
jgi:hypothetical protein